MTVKNFQDYIDEGVVRIQQKDISRAEYLIEEAKKSYLSLGKIVNVIKIEDITANTVIKLSHDIIHELIRAIMFKEGFSASGNGAHEAEVSYLRNLGFQEKDVSFIDQLRYSRNSINYYGKILDREYAEIIFKFLTKNYPILLRIAEK